MRVKTYITDSIMKMSASVFLFVILTNLVLSAENEKPLAIVTLFPEPNCLGFPFRITVPKTTAAPGTHECTTVGGNFYAKSAKLSGTGTGCRNGSLSSNKVCEFGAPIVCGKCVFVDLSVSSVHTVVPPVPKPHRPNNQLGGHGPGPGQQGRNLNQQSFNGQNGGNLKGNSVNEQGLNNGPIQFYENDRSVNQQSFQSQNNAQVQVQNPNLQNSQAQRYTASVNGGGGVNVNQHQQSFKSSSGNVVKHVFNISYITGSPDGVQLKKILAINKKFPGPTIVANIGDILEVDVFNNIQDGQNVSLHWHGIHEKGTPFEDGPSFVTQCPIKKHHGQKYRVPLQQSGTYWYHSHVGSQYTEGLWGALVVLNKPEVYNYDADFVITLNDWYHTSAKENEKWFLTPRSGGSPPYPYSALMNGLGRFICQFTQKPCNKGVQKRPVFKLTPSKVYRLRLINTAAWSAFTFGIDDHKLQVIEVDGVDVAPSNYGDDFVDAVFIGPGQRYSFLLKNTGTNGFDRHLIRAQLRDDLIGTSAHNINTNPGALTALVTGVIEYTNQVSNEKIVLMEPEKFDFEKFVIPSTARVNILNDSSLVPYDRIPAPYRTDINFIIVVDRFEDENHIHHVSFNGTPFSLPKDKPLLVSMLKNEPLPRSSLPLHIEYMSVVQMVINNPHFGVHPMHLHGYTFWVLGQGERGDGNYNPQRHNLNLNSLKRDTVMLQEQSWVVIKFVADNVGVWACHCHIDWHNLEGMAMTLVVGESVARRQLRITDEAKQVCAQHGIFI